MHPWRDHPHLAGRFHPDYPDDVQVLVHDGGPRLSQHNPELVWVALTGTSDNIFRGCLLNQPHQLQTVREGDEIQFVAAAGTDYLIRVTPRYLQERTAWNIAPCDKCGFSELFDAPSDLIRVIFPDTPPGGQMEAFTTFCPLCGGIQVVRQRTESPSTKRPWWRFGAGR